MPNHTYTRFTQDGIDYDLRDDGVVFRVTTLPTTTTKQAKRLTRNAEFAARRAKSQKYKSHLGMSGKKHKPFRHSS
jgi:hypothetical protein